MSYETKTVTELKTYLKKYDLISGINKLKKKELLETIKIIEEYKNNKQIDYTQFKLNTQTIKLNAEQHNIVTSNINQNIRIIASAGSGKTTTIICKIKYLIDSCIDPETIMVTTFNVDSAESIRNKLSSIFGFMPKVTVGTIDSIACKYYHRYFRQKHQISVSEYTSYFLKYLQTEENHLQYVFKYIFLDEAQDFNPIQFKILECFYKFGAYICVIGDDAQCLYSFRGSEVGYILNLEKYFNNLVTYKLIQNYRSTPEIIAFANASIKFNTEQLQKDMIANNPSIGFIPTVQYFNDTIIQNACIIKQIIELNKNGIPYEEIAILCRNNSPLKILEELFEKFNSEIKENDNMGEIKYIALITDNGDVKPKIKKGHVTLTTIHKSKGLEWQVVFVIGCDDNCIPSETDHQSIQEERRLFYVAVTRSKQYLYLYFCGVTRRGEYFEPKITRFIQELDKNLYKFVNYDDKFFSYDDFRTTKWAMGVCDCIKLLNESDLQILRERDILPLNMAITRKVHSSYEFNDFISSYYLQPEFGEFIDRYITRCVGKT